MEAEEEAVPLASHPSWVFAFGKSSSGQSICSNAICSYWFIIPCFYPTYFSRDSFYPTYFSRDKLLEIYE
jgi:hypothetical protein